ncbi:MAG: cysteine--tRNA ligase [Saprospirales bacterium]|nr:cysteine--tRNA ligase [Saprospirales bacterium]MBK7335990.1 cysteine--tRNA ligase [Saprospirales bacterium]
MKSELRVFNTLSGEKEDFKPLHEGHVGMYVCGPTVYSDVHLGNCRTFVSFDVIYRYLLHLGYKVRYVRNITDVGHLEGDADTDAEDKISKKARLEELEPMEIVQTYMNGFHHVMNLLNALPPNIEPRATGHILEQIEMVQTILDNGYAYVEKGSVYFDTARLIEKKKGVYGKLSGRKPEELLNETRDLKKQDEKRSPIDFAIWIKADPSHLMRWNSPWSVGFPGWHLECSAMSTKYLGKTFDIHGGGYDLKFPHHENEIAQSQGACDCTPARYWLHGNMLMLNGSKMSKSTGNSITPHQLLTGDSPHVTKAYSFMVLRFFMLQSHYRSTLDMTDEALQAAEKGYRRMMEAYATLQGLQHPGKGNPGVLDEEIKDLIDAVYDEINDDFNTPRALARLFELVTKINALKGGQLSFDEVLPPTLELLKETFRSFLFDVFGLKDESESASGDAELMDGLMQLIIQMRKEARERKDFPTSDKIRDALKELSVQLKDGKEGTAWVKE